MFEQCPRLAHRRTLSGKPRPLTRRCRASDDLEDRPALVFELERRWGAVDALLGRALVRLVCSAREGGAKANPLVGVVGEEEIEGRNWLTVGGQILGEHQRVFQNLRPT